MHLATVGRFQASRKFRTGTKNGRRENREGRTPAVNRRRRFCPPGRPGDRIHAKGRARPDCFNRVKDLVSIARENPFGVGTNAVPVTFDHVVLPLKSPLTWHFALSSSTCLHCVCTIGYPPPRVKLGWLHVRSSHPRSAARAARLGKVSREVGPAWNTYSPPDVTAVPQSGRWFDACGVGWCFPMPASRRCAKDDIRGAFVRHRSLLGVLSRGFRPKRSAAQSGRNPGGMRARGRFQPPGGYGGLEAGSWKAVGSGAKAVGIGVGIGVGSLNFRLEGGWKG
jgi:hypothetical protein